MNLLFFASDYQIGLSSLLTDQLIAINSIETISVYSIAGEKEQELGLDEKLKSKAIFVERIYGLDGHADFLRLANTIRAIIEKRYISVVHVQNNWQLALVSFVKYSGLKRRKFKIVYTLHGFRHNHPVKLHIARFVIGFALFLFADKILYMSEYVKKNFAFLSYKMNKIYLGIDNSFFDKKNNVVQVSPIKMIFPAQFRSGKNQDVIIKAFGKYINSTNDNSALLYLPGTGVLKESFEKLSKELQIEKQVIFPGFLSKNEIRELYESCNIGVISSNSETFGQSIVEPFVLGKCVLTTRVGVAEDIIKDGVNGFFFENENDLFEILLNLSKNEEKILEISTANFLRRDGFSWDSISKLYEKFILKL
jgi:glycosyltransferase involved in cell wall biosynthesis